MYLDLTHTLSYLVAIFFTRHWLPAITDAAVTALLGLGLVGGAVKWHVLELSPLQSVHLKRFVLLIALYKGALCLLIGVSRCGTSHLPVMLGMQVPDPPELLGLVPASTDSIWYPTSATRGVSFLLLGTAFCFLFWRALQMARSKQALNAILRLGSDPAPSRIPAALGRAAEALGLAKCAELPNLLLVDLPYPSPMLVGIRRPYLLIAAPLAQCLTDTELEMAFRHELAHFRRRDHWWRWLFTWLEDVGRLNLLSTHLGTKALDLEEELCDRLAVRMPEEALALAAAIRKSALFYQEQVLDFSVRPQDTEPAAGDMIAGHLGVCSEPPDGRLFSTDTSMPNATGSPGEYPQYRLKQDYVSRISLPADVLPALLGRHTRKWDRSFSLRRLESLLRIAQELSCQQHASAEAGGLAKASLACYGSLAEPCPAHWQILRRWGARLGVGLLLFLIIYTKFYIAVTPAFLHP